MAVHLSIGQEGVAVGVVGHSRPGDLMVGTHRSHAFYLAKGGDLKSFVDELYSLPTGCTYGRGGSMHLADASVGFLGASAVLGGGVPIALGLAFAKKEQASDDVVFAVTGDGGVDEGSFYESLNLAALWELPVIFVVENNGYSTFTPVVSRQARVDILEKSRAFGVPASRLDGCDTEGLAVQVSEIVNGCREGNGPHLIEVLTHRRLAHVGIVSDWGAGRDPAAEPDWNAVDPLAPAFWKKLPHAEQLEIHARLTEHVDHAFRSAIERFEDMNQVAKLEAPPAPNPSAV